MEDERKDVTEREQKPTGTEGNESAKTENKVPTFDELLSNKEHQAEFDRRVQKAINTARDNWKVKQDESKTEAERLAKMNETEKLQYQADKERKEKENALNELNAYKLKEQAISIGSDKNLEVSLLDCIDFKTITAEKLNEVIETFSNVFNKAVEKRVNEQLREDTPITKLTGITGNQTKPIPKVF